MIGRGNWCRAIETVLLVAGCFWLLRGTTAAALTQTPTPTPTRTSTPCPTGTWPLCPSDASVVCAANPCDGCSCATHTPTPIPTGSTCNPAADDCPLGTDCYCCCGGWVCMPPFLPCCAIPCFEPTQLPTPTSTPGADCDVCDGRSCQVGGYGGNCLIQPNDGCACIPEVTPSMIPSVTPTPPPGECVGDCSGDVEVTIDEIIAMVEIALNGCSSSNGCCAFVDRWCDGGVPGVSVDCIIAAVGNALDGCGGALPCAIGQCLSTLGNGCTGHACGSGGSCGLNELCDLRGRECPCLRPTPALPHGHTCCECENAVCMDFAWVEVEPACPLGCQTFLDAECEAPCHGGPQGGPAACAPLTPCVSDADCDDGNACTADQCAIDQCTHACLCV